MTTRGRFMGLAAALMLGGALVARGADAGAALTITDVTNDSSVSEAAGCAWLNTPDGGTDGTDGTDGGVTCTSAEDCDGNCPSEECNGLNTSSDKQCVPLCNDDEDCPQGGGSPMSVCTPGGFCAPQGGGPPGGGGPG